MIADFKVYIDVTCGNLSLYVNAPLPSSGSHFEYVTVAFIGTWILKFSTMFDCCDFDYRQDVGGELLMPWCIGTV